MMSFPYTTQPCKFFELPPELRTAMYEFVLLEAGPIDITTTMEGSHFRDQPLLRTCIQISLEATPIYYKHNTFYCLQYHLPDDDIEDCVGMQWLESLGKWRRSKLTRVRIEHKIRHPLARLERGGYDGNHERIFRRTREEMWCWMDEYAQGVKGDVVSVRPF